MPFQDLSKLGYRPEGSGAGAFLETIISGVEATGKFVDSYLAGAEKKQKREKDKIDAYVTLRKAGYPEKAAYEAINKWDFTKLQGIEGAGDLETTKTKKEIEKIEADVAYTKKKTENLGKAGIGGGYDDPEDIPKEAGGLPLKAVKQDKKTGMWYGDYGKGTADEDFVIPGMDEATETTRSAVEKKSWTPPNWLSGIIGKWEKPAGAAEVKEDPQEEMIKANMAKYGKSRAEVVAALRKKGKL